VDSNFYLVGIGYRIICFDIWNIKGYDFIKMDYKGDNGKVLKGFSQIDLDELNKGIKKLTLLLSAFVFWIILTVTVLLYWIKKYRIVTIILNALK
jgi:hypothetical protein